MNELIGRKIIVYSEGGSGERQDIGTLESIDERWLKLKKHETEVLYFALYNIRMVKQFDQA
jgi:hypothetical protein